MTENTATAGPWGHRESQKHGFSLVASAETHPELASVIDADFEEMFSRPEEERGLGLAFGFLCSITMWALIGCAIKALFLHH